jgi:hypothetical protein
VLLCPIDSKEFVVLPMPNHDSVVTHKVIRSHSNAFRQNKLWTSQTIDHPSPQHYRNLTTTGTALVVVLSDQTQLSKEKMVFCVISSHTYKAKATHQHQEHDLPSPLYLSQTHSTLTRHKSPASSIYTHHSSIVPVLRTTFGLCVACVFGGPPGG